MLQMNRVKNKVIKYKGLLGILPAFLFILTFFVGGAIQSVIISIDNNQALTFMSETEKFWAYKEIMNKSFLSSIWVTVGMAFIVALLSGIIGLLIALYLAIHADKWKWLNAIFQLPFGIPHLLAAYMLSHVFFQSGFYARILYHIGLIDTFESFPVLIHDKWGVGVLLAYLWKEIPFMILLVYPFIVKLLSEWKETGHILGANFSQLIRWVVVPILLPIWVGGMWIIFSFVLGAYEIPALLARTSFGSIPVLAWQEYSQFGLERQPVAIAMNIIIAAISFVVGVLLIYLQRKWYKQGRRLW